MLLEALDALLELRAAERLLTKLPRRRAWRRRGLPVGPWRRAETSLRGRSGLPERATPCRWLAPRALLRLRRGVGALLWLGRRVPPLLGLALLRVALLGLALLRVALLGLLALLRVTLLGLLALLRVALLLFRLATGGLTPATSTGRLPPRRLAPSPTRGLSTAKSTLCHRRDPFESPHHSRVPSEDLSGGGAPATAVVARWTRAERRLYAALTEISVSFHPLVRPLFCACLTLATLSVYGSRPASAQTIQTNRAQRSTVRVFAVQGVDVTEVRSKTPQKKRPFGIPRAGHGSGVLLSEDGLVLTAKHVVHGARLLAIRAPGHERAYSARVVYEHPDLDFAFVVAAGLFADNLPLPDAAPAPAMGDPAVAIGYPLDSAEELPTQSNGSLAGLTRDRHYKLSMSLNPGNSGGPVLNAHNDLLGIAIKTTDPRRGAQGLSIAVPLEPILVAFKAVQTSYKQYRDNLEDNSIAQLTGELVMAGSEGLHAEVTRLATGPTRTKIYNAIEAASKKTKHPDVQALLAAYFFDLAGALLEHNGVYEVAQMPPGKARDDAKKAMKLSIALAEKAAKADPTIRKRSPFIGVLLDASSTSPRRPPPTGVRPPPPPLAAAAPKYLPYSEGDPIPDGYAPDTRVRRGLAIGGGVTLGVLWAFTAVFGAVFLDVGSLDDDAYIPLFFPAVGPFIAVATMEANVAGGAVLVIDGIAQTAGLAMFIAGLAAPEPVLRRKDGLRVDIQPLAAPGHYGLGLTGAF